MLSPQNRERRLNWQRGYLMIMTNSVWLSASLPILTAGLRVLRKDKKPQSWGKASAVIALIRERREQVEREAAEISRIMGGQMSMFVPDNDPSMHGYGSLRRI